jgi:hypothetical protein
MGRPSTVMVAAAAVVAGGGAERDMVEAPEGGPAAGRLVVREAARQRRTARGAPAYERGSWRR